MKGTMNRPLRLSECFKFTPDMDPFFLDGEEDQLLGGSESSPSEDIWKKFEFLPTPPRSPSAEEKSDDERFSLVSDFLFDDDLLEFNRRQPKVDGEVIFDCMWSGRVGVAATTAVLQHAKTVVEAPLACMPVAAVPLSPLPAVLAHFAPPFEVVPTPTECVDPYPLSDHSYHVVFKVDEEQETTIRLTPVPKKDLLGVQTPSDSDDEVDVETVSEKFLVHKPRTRRGSLPSQLSPQVQRQLQRTIATKTKTSKKLLCPRSNLHTAKVATVSSNSSNNNLAAKSRRDDRKRSYHYNHLRKSRQAAVAAKMEKEQEQQQKRKADAKKRKWKSVRVKENTPVVPCSPVKKSRFGGNSSRTSSDSEDLDKRKEHNDLERRRRNDLKSSFQYLRQNVPDLVCQERAPKVLILRKAVEYIEQMMLQHVTLEKRQKIEEKKNAQLQRKLAGLQRIVFGSR